MQKGVPYTQRTPPGRRAASHADHCSELQLCHLCPLQPLGQGNKDFCSPFTVTHILHSVAPLLQLASYSLRSDTCPQPSHVTITSETHLNHAKNVGLPVYLIFMFLPPKLSSFTLIQSLVSHSFLHKASSPTLKALRLSFKAIFVWTISKNRDSGRPYEFKTTWHRNGRVGI